MSATHLNSEIVLLTISTIDVANEWIRSTFLYSRVFKNPKHYGLDVKWTKERIETRIEDWVRKELNGLKKYGLIQADDSYAEIKPTELGRLMAHYYVSLETMKKFTNTKGKETLSKLD